MAIKDISENLNVSEIRSKVISLDKSFSEMTEIIAKINKSINEKVNVDDNSAVFSGGYGSSLLNTWNENTSTFSEFRSNFEMWSNAISLIVSNNVNFTSEVVEQYKTSGKDAITPSLWSEPPTVTEPPTIMPVWDVDDDSRYTFDNRYLHKLSPLQIYFNGKYYNDGDVIYLKKGEVARFKVIVPTDCGKINKVTRTTADGDHGSDERIGHRTWEQYFTGRSEPFVDRYNSSTAKHIATYDWVVTAKNVTPEKGIELSQTCEFSTFNGKYPGNNDGTTCSGYSGKKAMIGIKVIVTE